MNVSCYFTDTEEAILRQLAAEKSTAMNAIIRTAFRQLVGLPTPSWAAELEGYAADYFDQQKGAVA